eukprot:scaffold86635_cov60-Phaeocystis_antarctica.AAC.2
MGRPRLRRRVSLSIASVPALLKRTSSRPCSAAHLSCHGTRYVRHARGWYAYPVLRVFGLSCPMPPVRINTGAHAAKSPSTAAALVRSAGATSAGRPPAAEIRPAVSCSGASLLPVSTSAQPACVRRKRHTRLGCLDQGARCSPRPPLPSAS